jgi:hypothetical protein
LEVDELFGKMMSKPCCFLSRLKIGNREPVADEIKDYAVADDANDHLSLGLWMLTPSSNPPEGVSHFAFFS